MGILGYLKKRAFVQPISRRGGGPVQSPLIKQRLVVPQRSAPVNHSDLQMTSSSRIFLFGITCLLILPWLLPYTYAQQLEPRRWSQLPIGAQYISFAYLYTDGDIFLDPVLRIEDAKMELNTFNARYLYSFDLAGRSARIEADLPYVNGSWQGLVDG